MAEAGGITLKDSDLEYIWQMIKISHRYHQRFVRAGRANVEYRENRRFTSFYAEEFEDRKGEGPRVGRVPINLFEAFFRATLPQMTMAQWRATAETRQSEYYPFAQRSEDHINWAHEVTGWDDEVELAIVNWLDYGRGIIRTGIGEPFTMSPITIGMQVPIMDPATGEEVPLGTYLNQMGRKTLGADGKEEDDRHIPLGHRRFPKGVVWQQSQSVEDVWGDFRARTPDDSGYMTQQHYLTGRQMRGILKNLRKNVALDKLPTYTLATDWRYLETEQDKRRGDQWAQLEADLASFPLYKLYEFWWREEDVYLILVDGMEKPLDVRPWPAPLGLFPYRFLEATNRQDRPTPISEFTGLRPDQDQINIFNSMATDAARRAKAILLYQKQLLERKERNRLERSGPLSVIGVRHDVEKVLKMIEITQNIDQWVQTIMRLESNARRRFGIIQEQMGQPSDVDTATQTLAIDKAAGAINDARIKRLRAFLKKACEDHQAWSGLAWNLWPKSPESNGTGESRIYPSAMGLSKEGGGYYPIREGFTRMEMEQKLRWKIDVLAQNPADREQRIERIERWWSLAENTGASNAHKVSRYLFELYEVNRNDLLKPEPDDLHPAEEHDLILRGGTPKISPYEDYRYHSQRHEKFMAEVQLLYKLTSGPQRPQMKQQMQNFGVMHFAYLKNPEAFKKLVQHNEITKKMGNLGQGGAGGGGGKETRSLEHTGMSSNRLLEGDKKRSLRSSSDLIPMGGKNTALEQVARQGL